MLLVVCVFQLIRMDIGGIGWAGAQSDFLPPVSNSEQNGEQILILYDSASEESAELLENYEALLGFYQLGYRTADMQKSGAASLPAEGGTLLSCVKNLEQIDNLSEAFEWMERGGNLVQGLFPEVNGVYYSYMSYFGINEVGDFLAHKGLVFSPGFLFLSDATSFDYPAEHNYAHNLRLGEDCTPLIRSADGTPLLWTLQKGEGELYFFNTTSLLRREARGILTGLLGRTEETLLYPAANTLTVILDGYSFPITPQVSQLVYSKYQTNYRHYLSSMVEEPAAKLQNKYGVRYTASYVNALNAVVEAPYPNDGITRNELYSSFSQLLNGGGELAICGYNYKPLGLEGEFGEEGLFTPFPSLNDIRASLDKTIRFAQDSFSGYQPQTYIPPAGQVGGSALSAVEQDTSLNTVVGVYDRVWKNELQQEFGLQGGLYHYPKITRIEREDSPNQFSALSSLMAMGAVSVDLNLLDQLMQEGSDLRGCWEDLDSLLGEFEQNHPYVSFTTISEAAGRLNRLQAAAVEREETQDALTVRIKNRSEDGQYVLRTSRSVEDTQGCSVQRLRDGVYLVTPERDEFTITYA